ncbi:MAG: leucine-rich repeat domain-containing protein [Thermoguttaceae bacterium]|nr:leucine-rich repeat domain-containing protein [Thermoguttaceae bacterium]
MPTSPSTSASLPTPANAFDWRLDADGRVVIQKLRDSSAVDVVVPARIDENPVVAIADAAFAYAGLLTSITLPESVEKIGANAFFRCVSLTDVALPNALREIDSSAFDLCESLRSLRLPDALETLAPDAFNRCASLTELLVFHGNTRFRSVDGVLFDADGKTLFRCPPGKSGDYVVPDGVERIAPGAFDGCALLTSVTFPTSLQTLDAQAFRDCPALTQFQVAPENKNFRAVDGVLYSFDGKTLARYPEGKGDAFEVPAGVEIIGDGAFSGCKSLRTVALPLGLRSLDANAFSGCKRLTSAALSDGLQHIGESTFRGCKRLRTASLPTTLRSLGAGAFYGCKALTDVKIPDGIATVGAATFYACFKLRSVAFPDGLREIGASAFYACDSLTQVF